MSPKKLSFQRKQSFSKKSSSKKSSSQEKILTLGEHLEELRKRIIGMILTIFSISVAIFLFSQEIHKILVSPYSNLTRDVLLLQSVYGNMEVILKLSLTCGFAIGLPVCIFLLWGFASPAVNRKASRVGNISVAFSSLLFWGGVLFAWYYIFPAALAFLLEGIPLEGVSSQTSVEKYYSFLFLVHIGCGVAFQMPLLTVILGWLGILTFQWHRKNWQYSTVAILAFSALITPPDPLSLIISASILFMLYIASVSIVFVSETFHRRRDGM